MFDAEYHRLLNEDPELACYAMQSRRRSVGLAVLREARKLWFTDKGQPESCSTLFEAALSAGVINEQDIRLRLRLALEGNNLPLAIKLAERIDGKHTSLPVLLKSASSNPDFYLKKLISDIPNLAKSTATKPPKAHASPVHASSKHTAPPRISPEMLAQYSCVKQSSFTIGSLENPPLFPDAVISTSTEGWFGLKNLFRRPDLGNAERLLQLPADPNIVENTEPSSSPGRSIQASSTPGATSSNSGCDAPCATTSDNAPPPPAVSHPKLASEEKRAVALFALQRLAKQSPELANARWLKISMYFPVIEQRYFYCRLAYESARNLDNRALYWYKAAEFTPLDERQSAWRVRAALRAQDWQEVLVSVNQMSEQQQQDPAWQYWKARALQALGRPLEAREIFAPLSKDFNFYGQLASTELADLPVLSKAKSSYRPNQHDITDILAKPGIQRTLALYRVGMRNEALEEWRWALRNLNDRELLTASEIARRNEMYDRAIGAAEKTVNVHNFGLRYLAPYRTELQAHIREHGLDEAWVYGLMRQESRFATNARSETGAAGLMQIMPSTARWVARKLGLKSYRNALIHQLDTNLRLGTYYMKSVLAQSENNPVLASAAYNAGPTRALQWRGDRPLEGAIYTETIPFEETRDYVKKVMSNTVYYSDLFGNPPRSLKQRLGLIPAKPGGNKTADSLATIQNEK
jgi:soluble lytic murein transglycosylase-like protein